MKNITKSTTTVRTFPNFQILMENSRNRVDADSLNIHYMSAQFPVIKQELLLKKVVGLNYLHQPKPVLLMKLRVNRYLRVKRQSVY